MKRYAYLTRSGGTCRLADFQDSQPVTDPAGLTAVMVSRLDFDVVLTKQK
jgi:hypothetical protein